MSTVLPFSFPTHGRDAYGVVELPEEVDLSNAPGLGDDLVAVLDSGVPGVIVDMTATHFCDSTGINAVVRAYNRARVLGSWVRIVAPHPHVRKVFAITGIDQLVAVYPSMTAARRIVRDADAG